MAKKEQVKQETESLFKKTEPSPEEIAKEKDKITTFTTGLMKSEWARFASIAEELGITKHAVRAYALRYFLAAYEAGQIKPKKETQVKMVLPKV